MQKASVANLSPADLVELARQIKCWGSELGFQQVGITDTNLSEAEARLLDWLGRGFHGEMDYMARHGVKRARPAALVPGTVRVIGARMNYRPAQARDSWEVMRDGAQAFLSRYATGRDYHTVLRKRLQRLADCVSAAVDGFRYRAFTDSAPVMEVELAQKTGLGWRGKHTLLLNREAGSYFFLGEIYTDLALPMDKAQDDHCGTCRKCIDVCPTQAILAPYQLDARRCISYLTIEHKGAIPEELRPLMGNRVYGCDDCQLVCPWNRFAGPSGEPDFAVRNGLDDVTLVELFGWSEIEFHDRLAGTAIHRIGYERWLRNLAVGLGNAPTSGAMVNALCARADHPSALVREHVAWALAQHERSAPARHGVRDQG
ncbi:MAG: tRNA epoxyqueuosine(34) reductase QueG [Betaproteobacteria bacterium]|nr:tRNA epoxyqueuosine(34) reductase QueG [Betaproteobacteria bacterium]MDH3437978.1 tRNA epoxyqueuosine(34) reductase QueG [Betaproteobacteria bacterium]